MERDPVCNMEVDLQSSPAHLEYQGKTYYFCSISCKQDFEANPERYLEPEEIREQEAGG